MSDLLKVGSFNMKDNGINRNGGIREDGTSNAKYVANIIKEKEFDLLGTQELTIKYVNELALELHNYQFLGSYRYGNALKFLPYNENNNILTNQKVLETNTIWLPWIANNFPDLKTSIMKASIMPRVATIVVTEDNEHRKICMINTHLDYQVPSIQAKQLEKLKSIILKYSKEILDDSIKHKGTTIKSYTFSLNHAGSYQDYLLVHKNDGKHCKVCNEIILKTKIDGRSTYYCKKCQGVK